MGMLLSTFWSVRRKQRERGEGGGVSGQSRGRERGRGGGRGEKAKKDMGERGRKEKRAKAMRQTDYGNTGRVCLAVSVIVKTHDSTPSAGVSNSDFMVTPWGEGTGCDTPQNSRS